MPDPDTTPTLSAPACTHNKDSAMTEPNFEMYPFFVPSQSGKGNGVEYGYARTLTYELGGETSSLDQSWLVTPSAKLGPPRGVDQDVYMAVNELLYRYGGIPDNNTLYFTFYELLGALAWENSGQIRKRLRASLERISNTSIQARDSFWSKKRGAFISKTFRLWSVAFGFYRDPKIGLEEHHRLVFDPLFAENWRDDYQSGIDLSFYWQLDSHIAKRLYRLLDCCCAKPSYGKARSWRVDLRELRDLMPLGGYSYASQIQRIIAPAHEELIEKGFLADVGVYKPEGKRGPTLLRYEVAPRFDRRRIANVVEQDSFKAVAIQKMLAVTANLPERMSRERATALVDKHGPDRCLYYADIFPSYKGAKKAGLLVRAIEDGYDWERPSGYSDGRSSGESSKGSGGTGSSLSLPKRPGGTSVIGGSSVVRDGSSGQGGNSTKNVGHKEPEVSSEKADDVVDRATPEEKQRADEVYQQVLSNLSDDGGLLSVSVWFEGTYARSLEDGALTLVVPNEMARDYIGKRFKEGTESYLGEILEARGYTGEVELRLVVGEGG